MTRLTPVLTARIYLVPIWRFPSDRERVLEATLAEHIRSVQSTTTITSPASPFTAKQNDHNKEEEDSNQKE